MDSKLFWRESTFYIGYLSVYYNTILTAGFERHLADILLQSLAPQVLQSQKNNHLSQYVKNLLKSLSRSLGEEHSDGEASGEDEEQEQDGTAGQESEEQVGGRSSSQRSSNSLRISLVRSDEEDKEESGDANDRPSSPNDSEIDE